MGWADDIGAALWTAGCRTQPDSYLIGKVRSPNSSCSNCGHLHACRYIYNQIMTSENTYVQLYIHPRPLWRSEDDSSSQDTCKKTTHEVWRFSGKRSFLLRKPYFFDWQWQNRVEVQRNPRHRRSAGHYGRRVRACGLLRELAHELLRLRLRRTRRPGSRRFCERPTGRLLAQQVDFPVLRHALNGIF